MAKATMVVLPRMLGRKCLVERREAPEVTPGGIVIPDAAKERPREGMVLAVGPGRWNEDGSAREPVDVAVGNVVLFAQFAGTEVKLSQVGDDLIVLDVDECWAVLPA